MDTHLRDAITKATVETIAALGGETLVPKEPLDGAGAKSFVADTSVVISVVGNISGAFVLRCSQKYAAELAGSMLGVEVEPGSEEMKDAIGEVQNMIVGAVKRHLSYSADPYKMSIPTTIVGSDYTVHVHASKATSVGLVPFATKDEIIGMEAYVEKR